MLESWKSQAAGTAQLLKLLQTYKDIGDSKNEVRARGSARAIAAGGKAQGRAARSLRHHHERVPQRALVLVLTRRAAVPQVPQPAHV